MLPGSVLNFLKAGTATTSSATEAASRDPGDTFEPAPLWVFDPPNGVGIERHVPTIPLSQDEQRYEDLQRSLAVYRMVFGQPRQEDLLAYLVDRVSPERLEELRPLLRIDLRPEERPF